MSVYKKKRKLINSTVQKCIIIIIIISCCQHGSPWPSLDTRLHRPSFPASLQGGISTELLYIGSSWSTCLCSSMWRGPQDYIAYEFVFTSPASLIRLTWIVSVMSDKWPYSFCFVGCCLQKLFSNARSILV